MSLFHWLYYGGGFGQSELYGLPKIYIVSVHMEFLMAISSTSWNISTYNAFYVFKSREQNLQLFENTNK